MKLIKKRCVWEEVPESWSSQELLPSAACNHDNPESGIYPHTAALFHYQWKLHMLTKY